VPGNLGFCFDANDEGMISVCAKTFSIDNSESCDVNLWFDNTLTGCRNVVLSCRGLTMLLRIASCDHSLAGVEEASG